MRLSKRWSLSMNGTISLRPGRLLGANGFAETRDDHRLVLMNDEEQRAPFQRREETKSPIKTIGQLWRKRIGAGAE
jgi:hypothetical protein